MNQKERRLFLIDYLLKDNSNYSSLSIPNDEDKQFVLLRSLMNVRPPYPIGDDFLSVQDEFLKEEIRKKGIVDFSSLKPVRDGIYLWKGNITRLKVDVIVNAANSGLTGCYYPCHGCIDNAIHTYSGVELRLECAQIMRRQGHEERTGGAKITKGYNLPAMYVIHTVGPIVAGEKPREEDDAMLYSYRSSLLLAEERGLKNIAFCSISTGEYRFPHLEAARIALKAVEEYRMFSSSPIDVVFDVFSDEDYEIYERLLET